MRAFGMKFLMAMGLVFSLTGCGTIISAVITNAKFSGVEVDAAEMKKMEVNQVRTIEIRGTMRFAPASLSSGGLQFADLSNHVLTFNLLDSNNNVIRTLRQKFEVVGGGSIKSLEAGKPYSFIIRDVNVPENQWSRITKYKFRRPYLEPRTLEEVDIAQ